MEPRFGHDFSAVRIHDDERAAQSAQALNALAYTVGPHVVFGPGQHQPNSPPGRALIAHELTHTIQQGAYGTLAGAGLRLGAADDALEAQARRIATEVHDKPDSSGITGINHWRVQRQEASDPTGRPVNLLPFAPLNLPLESVEIGPGETIGVKNPQLIRVANSYKSSQASQPGAYIELSAHLSKDAQWSSARESTERSTLTGRMAAIRDVLQSLGVPYDRVDIQPPTIYADSAKGEVGVRVYQSRASVLSPFLMPTQPAPGKEEAAPPAAVPGSSALSDLLTIKYGPLSVELPKSIALKIPIPISIAKTLTIDLKAEVPGVFSFAITIDGLRYVRIAAKAGLEYDKDKGLAGSAGLQIQLVNQVLNAPNPEALRSKITAAGGKLTKAMQDYKTETDEMERLSKLADVASALGEMYDAIESAKSAAKPVPAATLDIGVKGPLGSQEEIDLAKRHPSYIGATLSIPF